MNKIKKYKIETSFNLGYNDEVINSIIIKTPTDIKKESKFSVKIGKIKIHFEAEIVSLTCVSKLKEKVKRS